MNSLLKCIWRRSFEKKLETLLYQKNLLAIDSHHDLLDTQGITDRAQASLSRAHVVCHGWAEMYGECLVNECLVLSVI